MEVSSEQLKPMWHYEAEENAITEVVSLQLLLWGKGMCVAGFDATGNPQKIKTFFFAENWDLHLIEQIFINEPMFAGEEPFQTIWLAEERNILVPEQLYVRDYAHEWIRRFHFLQNNEILFDDHLSPTLEAQIVFPIPEDLKSLLSQYLEGVPLKALSKVALALPEQTNVSVVKIISLPKLALLSLQEKGKNMLHQICSYENSEDIIYKIAIILQDKNLNQDQIKIHISGIAPFYNNIIEELQNYFSFSNEISNTTEATLDFLKKLYVCA